jgi:hypothetical protein
MRNLKQVLTKLPLLLLLALSACVSNKDIDLMDSSEDLPPSQFEHPDNPADIFDAFVQPDTSTHWVSAIGALSFERSMEMGGVEIFESGTIPLSYPLGRERKSSEPWWVVGFGEGEFLVQIPASGPAGEGELGGLAGTAYEVRGYIYPAPKCRLELYMHEFVSPQVEGHIAYGENEVIKGVGTIYSDVTVLPEKLVFDLKTVPLDTYAYSKTDGGMTLNIKEAYFIRHFEDPSSGCTRLGMQFSLDADTSGVSVDRGDVIVDGGWWEEQKSRALDQVLPQDADLPSGNE